MAELLDKMHPALKSLWNLENELRSALQSSVLLRRADASRHLESAKRHFETVLKELKMPRTRPADSEQIDQNSNLDYGEGQREQYGEGYRYRSEELTKGADKSTDHGWAGDSNGAAPIPDTAPKH